MKDSRFLLGVLAGVGLALLVAILVSVNQPRLAYGESGPGQANHLTAVTGTIQANQDVLYLIDSQQEVLLAYVVYGQGGGAGPKSAKKLEFLAARNIKWDKKLEDYGGTGPAKVSDVKKGVINKMENEEEGSTKP
ncbi:MAG: hypothetical protein HYU36_07580 [Planctomycetes bacterium]|nr:hypothetical protein [Planctomycetota bacterium]